MTPQECLYVGDGSSRELTGATNVGMDAILLDATNYESDGNRIDADDWHGPSISSLKEVLTLIK